MRGHRVRVAERAKSTRSPGPPPAVYGTAEAPRAHVRELRRSALPESTSPPPRPSRSGRDCRATTTPRQGGPGGLRSDTYGLQRCPQAAGCPPESVMIPTRRRTARMSSHDGVDGARNEDAHPRAQGYRTATALLPGPGSGCFLRRPGPRGVTPRSPPRSKRGDTGRSGPRHVSVRIRGARVAGGGARRSGPSAADRRMETPAVTVVGRPPRRGPRRQTGRGRPGRGRGPGLLRG